MQAGAMSWVRSVNRVERTDNGWRIRANTMFLEFPYHTWFRFPIDTIVTIPTIFRDMRMGTDLVHSLNWGRFELPAEFEIPPGYVILKPTMVPYRITEGTVRMPCNRSCRIMPRAEMRYRMEDPDDPTVCSFWIDGDLREMFPDGTFIYVDYPRLHCRILTLPENADAMSWHRPVSRVERTDNGWRIRANNLFLEFPWHTWFRFPIDTIVTIPTIFSDLRRGMDKEHSLAWGRFELPAEFEIPPGYDILLPTYVPYGIHEGTVRMPSKKKCRIIPRADMRYRMEDPDDPAACSFWVYGDLKFLFPDGTYIYVDSLPPELALP
ncbi:hypothetical protein R1sor_007911 [Riccia sorocarpa]|uniref:DUF432 domain-containing protein n=1 Tax=Riccia sorocarpa TaxID=122646 RepID=A0ABD3HRV2_9MARC